MSEMFDIGIKASNFKHLKKLYTYEHAKTHDSADEEMLNKIDALTSINDRIDGIDEYIFETALAFICETLGIVTSRISDISDKFIFSPQ